jgi:nucleotidyltransferase substrate binding protein (TIGR01987 family)
MENKDIRWEQRFSNYRKALLKLSQAIEYIKENIEEEDIEEAEDIDEIENVLEEVLKEGLIQRFEYTHELAWNIMKDYAEYQGNTTIKGPRDATREAFKMKLVSNAEAWMEMMQSRNQTSHTYNEETANAIYQKIIEEYYPAFLQFEKTMEEIRTGKQGDLFDKE